MGEYIERCPLQKRQSKQNEVDQGDQKESSPEPTEVSTVTVNSIAPVTPLVNLPAISHELSAVKMASSNADGNFYSNTFNDSDNEETAQAHSLRPCKIEKAGSESSEAGTSSSLSRDSSVDAHYTDSTGIDLEDFIRMTINRTPRDRQMLLQLEKDLLKFVREPVHHFLKFPPMSSYNRMLVHRVAAFFGLDHNVDQSGKAVIVNKTSGTREPDFCFADQIRSGTQNEARIVLKCKGSCSLDESLGKSYDKNCFSHDKRAKSLDERQATLNVPYTHSYQHQYSSNFGKESLESSMLGDDLGWSKDRPWSSTDSSGYSTDTSIKSKLAMGGSVGEVVSPQYLNQPFKQPHLLNKSDSNSSGASGMGSPMFRPPYMPPSDGLSNAGSVYGGQSSNSMMYWWPQENLQMSNVMLSPQMAQPPYAVQDGSIYRPSHMHPAQHCSTQPAVAQNTQAVPVYHQPTMVNMDRSTYPLQQDTSSTKDICQQMAAFSLNSHTPSDMQASDPNVTTPVPGYQPLPQPNNNQHLMMQQGACYSMVSQPNQVSNMRYMYPCMSYSSSSNQISPMMDLHAPPSQPLPHPPQLQAPQQQVASVTQAVAPGQPYGQSYYSHNNYMQYPNSCPTNETLNSYCGTSMVYPVDNGGMIQCQYQHQYHTNTAPPVGQQNVIPVSQASYYGMSATAAAQQPYSANATSQWRTTSPINQVNSLSVNQNNPIGVTMPTPSHSTSPGHPGDSYINNQHMPATRPHLPPLQFIPFRPRMLGSVGMHAPSTTSVPPPLKLQAGKKTSERPKRDGGQIYEIYDFSPGLHRSDGDCLFDELISIGASIQYLPHDSNTTLSTYMSDFTVLAIFAESPAPEMLVPLLNNPRYKLRPAISASGSTRND